MKPHPSSTLLLVAASLLLVPIVVPAQLVISGNENKLDLTPGTAQPIPGAAPDSLTFLDFSVFPPRVEHVSGIANTVIGPPSNIAIAPDGRLALVANSIRLDSQATTGFSPHTEIHILDLQARPPRVVDRVDVGRQPSGLSLTRDGRRALVANRADGTVSLLGIEGLRVSVLQTARVCAPEEAVSDVAIHPGGRLALASVQKGGYLAVLDLDGDGVAPTGRKLSVYGQPYRCVITPDGQLGLTAGQGHGNGPDADALSVIDLTARPIRTTDFVRLGSVPESFEVSPDGEFVAAVMMNGSNLAPGDSNRTEHGAVVLLRRQGSTYVRVQEVPIGRIPEGVAFTSDGRYLVVQCHPDRQLWIFETRRGRLRDTGQRIAVPGMPSSLRAAP